MFRMVIVWASLVPTVAFPNATELGTTEICGCTPVPVRLIVVGEFVALLTTETLPELLAERWEKTPRSSKWSAPQPESKATPCPPL